MTTLHTKKSLHTERDMESPSRGLYLAEEAGIGDIDEIKAVWDGNLPVMSSAKDKFLWFYEKGPLKKGSLVLLRAGESRQAIGTGGIGYRRVMINGGINISAVAADLVVARAHRTLFPALLQQRKLLEIAQREALFVYGMPNEDAQPVFKRLGYRKVSLIRRYAKVLRGETYIRKRLNEATLAGPLSSIAARVMSLPSRDRWKGVPERFTSELGRGFDRRFDGLWARASQNFRCAGIRDSAFLNWRYSECPERQYSVFAISEDGGKSIDGYVVFYVMGRVMFIDDILSLDKDMVLDVLLCAFLKYARTEDIESISIGVTEDGPTIALLKSHGFRERPDKKEVFAFSASEALLQRITDAGWFLTWGDQDNS